MWYVIESWSDQLTLILIAVYVNFCVQVKIYLDDRKKYTRAGILRVWDGLGDQEEWSHVISSHSHRIDTQVASYTRKYYDEVSDIDWDDVLTLVHRVVSDSEDSWSASEKGNEDSEMEEPDF